MLDKGKGRRKAKAYTNLITMLNCKTVAINALLQEIIQKKQGQESRSYRVQDIKIQS